MNTVIFFTVAGSDVGNFVAYDGGNLILGSGIVDSFEKSAEYYDLSSG